MVNVFSSLNREIEMSCEEQAPVSLTPVLQGMTAIKAMTKQS